MIATRTVYGSIQDRDGRRLTVSSDDRGVQILDRSEPVVELDDENVRSLLVYLNLYGELASSGSVHVAVPMKVLDRLIRHSAALHRVAADGCPCDSALAKRTLVD